MKVFKNVNSIPVLSTECGLQIMFDQYTMLSESQVLILKLRGNIVASVVHPYSVKAFQLIIDTLTND
jgi:hypothetical protein